MTSVLQTAEQRLLAGLISSRPKLVVLVAPPGFGKTTIGRAYADTFPSAAFCDCARAMSAVTLADLLSAAVLSARGSNLELASALMSQDDVATKIVLAQRLWEERHPSLCVIFDNVECIVNNKEARRFLADVLRARPSDHTVILCSRVPLGTIMTRVVSQHAQFIGFKELSLTREETHRLATVAGLPDFAAQSIYKATEGWPLAVRLLIENFGRTAFGELSEFVKETLQRANIDQFVNEVVEMLGKSARDRLIAISSIPGITIDELASLVGADADDVEHSIRSDPFVRRSGNVLELHPVMRTAIEIRYAAKRTAALRSAAESAEKRGDFLRAAQLFDAMGNRRKVADLLEAASPEFYSDQIPVISELAGRLPTSEILGRPRLWISTLGFRRFSMSTNRLLEESTRMYSCLLPEDSFELKARVSTAHASILHQYGDPASAEQVLTSALREARERQAHKEAVVLLLRLAGLYAMSGRHSEARRATGDAHEIDPITASALRSSNFDAVEAHIAFAKGDVDRAFFLVEEAIRLQRGTSPLAALISLLNAATFAWIAGHESRFSSYVAEFEDELTPVYERGFRFWLDCAKGRADVTPTAFEDAVPRAIGHLFVLPRLSGNSAAERAREAVAESIKGGDPLVECLAHLAAALVIPSERNRCFSLARLAAERIEAPEILAAVTSVELSEQSGLFASFARRFCTKGDSGTTQFGIKICEFSAITVDGQVSLTRREAALLAYLFYEKRPVTREAAADALWPDADPADAINSLKALIHRLRRKLRSDDAILLLRSGYCLNPKARIDVDDFERLQDVPAEHERAASTTEMLMAAYGVLARRARAQLSEWEALLPFERNIAELERKIGLRLAKRLAISSRYVEAIKVLKDLVRHDPYDEEAQELLIRSQMELGDLSGAKQQWRSYSQAMKEEMQAEPSLDIAALLSAREP
jgi:DNA-binding SARP family transcriptional activator